MTFRNVGSRDDRANSSSLSASCAGVVFFSSRRRHTRFDCDWSSDVCSSDLLEAPTGRVLVSDFGIARVGSGSGTTGPREIVGTAEFMSPEQASGGVVDPRSDLYSLGVVAYYALSGRVPFEDADPYVLLARHATEPAPPLASVSPAVPRQLARIVDRWLAKEPSARFADGSELAQPIDDASPLHASPPIAVPAFLVASRHLSAPALFYATHTVHS